MTRIVPEIARLLADRQPVLITSHTFPDGDSIGSTLALCHALRQRGIPVTAVNSDPVPEMYRFLTGWEVISLPRDDLPVPQAVVVLDCTDLDRVGEQLAYWIKQQGPRVVVNIDHHVSNSLFGTHNYVDTSTGATAELVYTVIKALGADVDQVMATALYTGLATDTGSFRFPSTSAATYRLAAELLEHGVDLQMVNIKLWEEKPAISMFLLARVLPTLQITAAGQMAWMYLEKNIFDALRASSEHCEGFVDYPRSITGVELGMFFREIEENDIKVGLRSKSYLDVNRLAGHFGGGGHPRAAACTIHASLQEAIDRVVNVASGMLRS